ncbi:MAG: oligopeptide/dipeptide ABC transporter ATP-binding protein [Thermodesulfobacteriota bacterium]|nr:oligopeptide/dipeptide ABC transporter ATP-binding protein [Thermodesulfobacteriota bacterium]
MKPLLEVKGLKKYYPIKTGVFGKSIGQVKAVDGIDLDIYPNETVGLVGESGCGKSTLTRLILRLERPDEGTTIFDGIDVKNASKEVIHNLRRGMQVIFQDPFSSLNPRRKVGSIVEEPMVIHKIGSKSEIRKRGLRLMEMVGIHKDVLNRYPHEFSGGQRQRICIARALALNPEFVICDEPVSALDVSIQAQVINLLIDLQDEFGLSYLFISHDLSVVSYISNRVAVMYMGSIVELAPTSLLYDYPMHPYTQALLAAVPTHKPGLKRIKSDLKGDIPRPSDIFGGCVFSPKCALAKDVCYNTKPTLVEKAKGHFVACHMC